MSKKLIERFILFISILSVVGLIIILIGWFSFKIGMAILGNF